MDLVRSDLVSIGEVADRTGVAPSALRYYEEVGLLTPVARVGGRRHYAPDAVHVVGTILFLQDVGFSLAEIGQMLAALPAEQGWRALAEAKLAELDEKAHEIAVAREALRHALGCRHEDITSCPSFRGVVEARLGGQALAEMEA